MLRKVIGSRSAAPAPNAPSRTRRGADYGARLAVPLFCPYGREPTSSAFFTAAGIERLYSGVTNINPSQRSSSVRNRTQASGTFFFVEVFIVKRKVAYFNMPQLQFSGASSNSALAIALEYEPRRRLPVITPIFSFPLSIKLYLHRIIRSF